MVERRASDQTRTASIVDRPVSRPADRGRINYANYVYTLPKHAICDYESSRDALCVGIQPYYLRAHRPRVKRGG